MEKAQAMLQNLKDPWRSGSGLQVEKRGQRERALIKALVMRRWRSSQSLGLEIVALRFGCPTFHLPESLSCLPALALVFLFIPRGGTHPRASPAEVQPSTLVSLLPAPASLQPAVGQQPEQLSPNTHLTMSEVFHWLLTALGRKLRLSGGRQGSPQHLLDPSCLSKSVAALRHRPLLVPLLNLQPLCSTQLSLLPRRPSGQPLPQPPALQQVASTPDHFLPSTCPSRTDLAYPTPEHPVPEGQAPVLLCCVPTASHMYDTSPGAVQ